MTELAHTAPPPGGQAHPPASTTGDGPAPGSDLPALRVKPRRPARPASAAGGWRLLLAAAVMYAVTSIAIRRSMARVPPPLPVDAPAGLFSEGRAMVTTRHLAQTIGHRQVSTSGAEAAAEYLLEQARHLAAQAALHRPDLDVTAVLERVSGAVAKQVALHTEMANAYNDLANVVLRLAPRGSSAPAVLVNAHFDSTLGTAGASDAASCVGVALEVARTLVANASLTLPAPVVFLFNGGEETLMQASHGFMASSPHAKGLGAFVNLESTGPWGPDMVFQHTGDWTLRAYARAAPFPRGTTVAQDFFDLGLIPADTDYRMFSYRHYGELPGIDVAFIYDGTAYHTARDEADRIRPGTLQAMGLNLQATVLEFGRVLTQQGGAPGVDAASPSGHAYFDLFGKAMVVYTHRTAAVLHNAPLLALLVASLAAAESPGSWLAARVPPPPALLHSAGVALASTLGAMLLPAGVGTLRAVLSGRPMAWYGSLPAAYSIFLPAAAAGMLLPYAQNSKTGSSLQAARRQSLGTALLYALLASTLTYIGMHSAFLYVAWAAGALVAALLGPQSGFTWRGAAILVVSFALPTAVTSSTAMFLCDHVLEKIGLAGSASGLLGAAIPDAVIGVVSGTALYLAVGSLLPYLAAALGRGVRPLVLLLLAVSVAAAVGGSMGPAHPYSYRHPKRVILQHIHKHTQEGIVTQSLFAFSSLDPIPVDIALPPAATTSPPSPFDRRDWEALYPLNYLVTGTACTAPQPPPGTPTPSLTLVPQFSGAAGWAWRAISTLSPTAEGRRVGAAAAAAMAAGPEPPLAAGFRRVRLVLDTVNPGWAVLNVTGEVGAWSLGQEVSSKLLPSGSSSHVVRYASAATTSLWYCWMDTPRGASLRVELFVKHIAPTRWTRDLMAAMPAWSSPAPVTTWQSIWEF